MSRQTAPLALILLPLLALLPSQLDAAEAPDSLARDGTLLKTDPKWEAAALKKRAAVSTTPDAIVCIGSSHMANWKSFQADLKPLTVFNLGIGGSKMVHASEIFVPLMVIPAKPRAVILYEGSNDLSGGDSPETVLEHFRNLHHRLHRELPEARLYVLGIVPSPGKRFERWDAIQKTNALLKTECETQPWMRFLDTTTPLLGPDGLPRPECFIPNDPHMTPTGYESWTSVIAPVVVAAEKAFERPQTP